MTNHWKFLCYLFLRNFDESLKNNEKLHNYTKTIALTPKEGYSTMSFRHSYFFFLSTMATGTIKTKTDKGFGFISVDGSDDVFFHHSACNGQYDNLQIGQTVQFDVEQGQKGPKAANVMAA